MAFKHYDTEEQLTADALRMIPEFMRGKSKEKLINVEVLKFIAMFTNSTAEDYELSTVQLFQGGLCYYFARLLQDEFGGTIVFKKFGGHIAWMDGNKIIYDSFGIVFDYDEGDWLPIMLMDKIELDGFKHLKYYNKEEIIKAKLRTARNILSYELTNKTSIHQIKVTEAVISYVEEVIENKSFNDKDFNIKIRDKINSARLNSEVEETSLFY